MKEVYLAGHGLLAVSRLEDKEMETKTEFSRLHERYNDVSTAFLSHAAASGLLFKKYGN